MRHEYFEIYRDLYDLYLYSVYLPYPWSPWPESAGLTVRGLLRSIAGAIDDAIYSLGLREKIRPDAKLVILVNLHQLVVLPITHRDTPSPQIIERLPTMLAQDTRLIFTKAKGLAGDNQEITGRIMFKAVLEVWAELALTHIDIWG